MLLLIWVVIVVVALLVLIVISDCLRLVLIDFMMMNQLLMIHVLMIRVLVIHVLVICVLVINVLVIDVLVLVYDDFFDHVLKGGASGSSGSDEDAWANGGGDLARSRLAWPPSMTSSCILHSHFFIIIVNHFFAIFGVFTNQA